MLQEIRMWEEVLNQTTKAQEIKQKLDKGDFIKLKTFCSRQRNSQQSEETSNRTGDRVWKLYSWQMARIWNTQGTKATQQKTKIEIQGNDFKHTFHKDTPMANLKRCVTSLFRKSNLRWQWGSWMLFKKSRENKCWWGCGAKIPAAHCEGSVNLWSLKEMIREVRSSKS